MANPSPEQLFEQALKLAAPPLAGAPRQVDLRRAISSAYYGLFHFVLAALADELVGATQRKSTRYALVYRSVDHRSFKDLCAEVRKPTLPGRFIGYIPSNGLGETIQAFATGALELQARRHAADYDPRPRFKTSDARVAVDLAVTTIGRFRLADEQRRKTFLTLLVCSPRS